MALCGERMSCEMKRSASSRWRSACRTAVMSAKLTMMSIGRPASSRSAAACISIERPSRVRSSTGSCAVSGAVSQRVQ